jgi:hypothetical protein
MVIPYVTIKINRKRVLVDSHKQIVELSALAIRRKSTIKFEGELGYDVNGLTREFLHLASTKFSDPSLGLFRYSSESQEKLEIDPMSGFYIQRPRLAVRLGLKLSKRMRNLSYFKFFGRILGLNLLYHSTVSSCHLL